MVGVKWANTLDALIRWAEGHLAEVPIGLVAINNRSVIKRMSLVSALVRFICYNNITTYDNSTPKM
jgi:hypothetical protein